MLQSIFFFNFRSKIFSTSPVTLRQTKRQWAKHTPHTACAVPYYTYFFPIRFTNRLWHKSGMPTKIKKLFFFVSIFFFKASQNCPSPLLFFQFFFFVATKGKKKSNAHGKNFLGSYRKLRGTACTSNNVNGRKKRAHYFEIFVTHTYNT